VNPLQHWAYVEAQIKQEVNRVLKANGLTRSSFHELETQAIIEMREADVIETEFGSVAKHFTLSNEGAFSQTCDRLILTKKEKHEQV
jgi:hypothetical protein